MSCRLCTPPRMSHLVNARANEYLTTTYTEDPYVTVTGLKKDFWQHLSLMVLTETATVGLFSIGIRALISLN
jgi:hypothetical protein